MQEFTWVILKTVSGRQVAVFSGARFECLDMIKRFIYKPSIRKETGQNVTIHCKYSDKLYYEIKEILKNDLKSYSID